MIRQVYTRMLCIRRGYNDIYAGAYAIGGISLALLKAGLRNERVACCVDRFRRYATRNTLLDSQREFIEDDTMSK